jgi:sulfur-oxidizing protein SoxY
VFEERKMKQTKQSHAVTRRNVLAVVGASAIAATGVMLPFRPVTAGTKEADAAVKKVIGSRKTKSGRITLELPQIAENGNTVPISLAVDSPMTKSDYVKAVHIFAEANPNPEVASFHFTPRSGKAYVSTRMRMLKTQNIIAVAEMSNGDVFMAKNEVKVTIGGCGG